MSACIFEQLRQAADAEDALAMSAYMRHQFSFLGIKKSRMRPLTKAFLKEKALGPVDWVFISTCWQAPEREFQYLAMDYLRIVKKQLVQSDMERVKVLIETKSWWDTVDELSHVVGNLVIRFPELVSVIKLWSVDSNFWLRRVAIIHQLTLKMSVNTKLLEEVIVANLGSKEFFINKAIGWALRDYAKYDEDWVKQCVLRYRNQLSPLSWREATKHLDME